MVINHLNITLKLIDKDIKELSEKTKFEFINFIISQWQTINPLPQENNNNNPINLSFDINKLLPSVGESLIRSHLSSKFGPSAIVQQLHLFFIAINNHHLLLIKRNRNIYLQNKIDPVFIPNNMSSNSIQSKNKHKHKNYNNYNYFKNKRYNTNNSSSYYYRGKNQNYNRNRNRNKNRGGDKRRNNNAFNKSRSNSKNPYHRNNNHRKSSTQNRKNHKPSLIATFAPSFNNQQHSDPDDNDQKME